ncbi:MAG TPA: ATP-dependent Clp protease adaptor ClpS [Candidatus Margulisiibacteriota bacterium]|nr:ATP-dependent Clp protease adaptor ClpS [Candidatus Margulisiibacteriota bacterium]
MTAVTWGLASGRESRRYDRRLRGRFSWKIGAVKRIPIFVHWSVPAVGVPLFVALLFGLIDTSGYFVGIVVVLVVHELGHAAAARAVGVHVYAIDIVIITSRCSHSPPRRLRDKALIYSAGMLAQFILLLAAIGYRVLFRIPPSAFGQAMVETFIYGNAVILALSALPIPNNDGWLLRELALGVLSGNPRPAVTPLVSTVFAPETRLLGIEGLAPPGFTTGIEILNDDKTPMEFVIAVLERHLAVARDDAIRMMLGIHQHGGLLFPVTSAEAATLLAKSIKADSDASGHPLVCRAVVRDGRTVEQSG